MVFTLYLHMPQIVVRTLLCYTQHYLEAKELITYFSPGKHAVFPLKVKIKKDSIQLETTQSPFSTGRQVLISHPL